MTSHSTALETTITAAGRKLTKRDAALLALCRSLAAQMDATSSPGTRLVASYLTALRTLSAAIDRDATSAPTPAGKLAQLRSINSAS